MFHKFYLSILLVLLSFISWSKLESQPYCNLCGHYFSEEKHTIDVQDLYECDIMPHEWSVNIGYLYNQTGGCRIATSRRGKKTCWAHTTCSDCGFWHATKTHSYTTHTIMPCPGDDGTNGTDDDHSWVILYTRWPIVGPCDDSYVYDWDNSMTCEFHQ